MAAARRILPEEAVCCRECLQTQETWVYQGNSYIKGSYRRIALNQISPLLKKEGCGLV